MIYKYGMRIRGFSIGCQPMKGLVCIIDDLTGQYWDVLVYSRKLTANEVEHYDLDYLGSGKGDE